MTTAMEQKQHPFSMQVEERKLKALFQRRQAIQLFLYDPEAACDVYPQLKDDLITFFAQSTTPYMDVSGKPKSGREADYARWEAARHWALKHAGK